MKIKRSLTGLTFAVAAMLLTACGRTEINANDYLSAETSGTDGHGSVVWTLNADAMVRDNHDAFKLKETASQGEYQQTAADVNDKLYGAFDRAENLSNGDTVSFVWNTDNVKTLEKAYKIRLRTDSMEFPVNGLPETQQLDPFDYVTIDYQEYEGEVLVIIKPTGDIPFWLDFMVKEQDALHLGDEFTVKVGKTVDNQELTEEQLAAFCLDQGYEITAYEKVYQVPDTLQ